MLFQNVTFGDAVLAMGQIVLFAGFLALALERLVQLLIKPAVERFNASWALPYAAALVGVLFSLGFGVDLIQPLAEALGLVVAWPVLGEIVTGLVIGGGSNLLHDIWPGG